MSDPEKVLTLDLDAIRLRLAAYRRRAYLGRSEWTDLVAHAPADLSALVGRVDELESVLSTIAHPSTYAMGTCSEAIEQAMGLANAVLPNA